MKTFILLIFAIILSTSSSFANDLQLPLQSWDFMPQAEYKRVLTKQERLENPDFIRFPDWQDMEIVRHGKIKKELVDQVNVNLWNDDILIDSMRDLVLQAFDIWTEDIRWYCGYFITPFVIDIRYRESDLNGFLSRGTINSFGILQVITDKITVTDIKILRFDDSQGLERVGRKMGTIDQYDLSFIEGIVFPLLKGYLFSSENKNKLLALNEPFQKNNYCY